MKTTLLILFGFILLSCGREPQVTFSIHPYNELIDATKFQVIRYIGLPDNKDMHGRLEMWVYGGTSHLRCFINKSSLGSISKGHDPATGNNLYTLYKNAIIIYFDGKKVEQIKYLDGTVVTK